MIRNKTDHQLFIEDLVRRHPIPLEWKDGPIKDVYRRATDKLALVAFLGYIALMIITGIWAFANSHRGAFYQTFDSSGNLCGKGGLQNYRYLYMQRFTAPYKSICVKKCPKFDYNQIKYYSNGVFNSLDQAKASPDKIKPLYFKRFSRKFAGRSYTKSKILTEWEAFAYPKDWANNYFTKAQFDAYRANYKLDCHPNADITSCHQSPTFAIYDSYPGARRICVPLFPKAALLYNRLAVHFPMKAAEDIRLALPLLLKIAIVAFVVSIGLLAIIYITPEFSIWILLGGALLLLGGLIFIIWHGIYHQGYLNNPINPLRVRYLQFWMTYRHILQILALFLIVLILLGGYYIFRYMKYIPVARHLIQYSSHQAFKEPILMFMAVATLAIQISIMFLELYVIIRLCRTGREIVNLKEGQPYATYARPKRSYFFICIHAFGTYWLLTTIGAFYKFVVSGITVDMYFTSIIQPMHVLCHSLGHHIGSCVLYIFVMPVMALKYLLNIPDRIINDDNPTDIQRTMRKVFTPCCWIYENFIASISQRYMPITYIGSIDFSPANRMYYALSEVYADEVGVIAKVSNLIMFAGRTIAALLPASIGYFGYKRNIKYQQGIDHLWLLWILMVMVSYYVGTLFLNIYSMVFDANFVSYLVQLNLRDRGVQTAKASLVMIEMIGDYKNRAGLPYVPLN